MNDNTSKALEALTRMAERQAYYRPHIKAITEALNAPAGDGTAIEHRDLAMALAAALVEHVRNYFDGSEQDHAKLNEFQQAAQHEINRLYNQVFNQIPFPNANA